MKYTVTATGTYFVEAESYGEAQDIVYEALLGNDKESILGNGEIQSNITSIEGHHSTIPIDNYKGRKN